MKKLTQVVIAIQFGLMLTHCATSTDDLYREYTACREQTLHPKITEAGIVMVHADGSPIMVYATGSCPDELAKWEKSHAMKEKRRREREAYQAAVGRCGDSLTLVCTSHGAAKCFARNGRLDERCDCSCQDAGNIFRGIW